MPGRNGISLKVLLLPLALIALVAAVFGRRKGDEWDWEVEDPEPEQELPPAAIVRSRRPRSRVAGVALFTTLFFAGAAFTAGAGDQMVKIVEGDDDAAVAELSVDTAAIETVPTDAATAPAAAEPEAPVSEPAAEAPADPAASPAADAPTVEPVELPTEDVAAVPTAPPAIDEPAASPAATATAAPVEVPTENVASVPTAPAATSAATARPPAATPAKIVSRAALPPVKPRAARKPVLERAAIVPAPVPEIEQEAADSGEPTIWLNRVLPDPTPPSARLPRSFARALFAAAKRHDADWATVLGVLRAQGERGPTPASPAELDSLATQLAGGQPWRGALAVSGRTDVADRAEALADLYRSVGIETLITGYEDSKDRLAKRLLENENVLIYAGGRADIAAGRIDVRILVSLAYLAERHGSIAVSSLFSGHRMFSRPGVVSAHMYGQAADVAAVHGTAIAGNQQPGGITEAAVRSLLLFPSELQPQQVISLLGLGGPSFPMRDHGDHIHVGF